MEIEIFSLADYAADQGGGKLTIVGTFDTLFARQFPTVHPAMSVVTRMRIANKDARKYSFKLRLIGPEKKELSFAEGQVDVKPNPKLDYNAINFVWNLVNTSFEKPGKYAIEFTVDGEWKRGLVLQVQAA